jgi:hypothetical protein
MAEDVGPVPLTYGWACATNGALSDPQKAAARSAVRSSYVAIALGLLSSPFRASRASTELVRAPDSRLARTAEEAALVQGPALAGHGCRTWLLGSALAEHDRVAVDAELLYVTALLHDSGMTAQVVGQDFTVRSGALLIDVCARAGVEDGTARRAADAAVAHASPGLTAQDDPVGFYVQSGAMADLAGLRMWDLPRGFLRAAYRSHPAHGVHPIVAGLIRREARQVPDGRFAILRRAGMDVMVTLSPTRVYARLR